MAWGRQQKPLTGGDREFRRAAVDSQDRWSIEEGTARFWSTVEDALPPNHQEIGPVEVKPGR
ncbi:MAG: hypothetical protein VB859_11115 [Planctomycetaceae bacterium]